MTDLTIRTVINDQPVAQDHVLAWEASRFIPASKKIGIPLPPGSLEQRRMAFADAKLALDPAEVKRRLARDLTITDAAQRIGSATSRGQAKQSVCDLHVTGGSARAFVEWFSDTSRSDYVRTMVAANPDHFLIDTAADGTQEVIETTGGNPFATHFFVDYTTTSPLTSPRDNTFPLELAGVAQQDNGRLVGGVRHQFRDEPGGFHARLLVEFPRLTPTRLIAEHQVHLACEFGNWIRLAFAD